MAELKNCPVCGTPSRMMVHDGCYSVEPIGPRWISVDERPPVWPCVVYDGHNPPYTPKGCIAILHDTEGSVKWIPEIPLDALMQGHMPELHNFPITHWMPLPEPPKEEHR